MKNRDGSHFRITKEVSTDLQPQRIPKNTYNQLQLSLIADPSSGAILEQELRIKINQIFEGNQSIDVFRWKSSIPEDPTQFEMTICTYPVKKKDALEIVKFLLSKNCLIREVRIIYESFIGE